MSQRTSGYKPVKGDAYYTPAWVTEALLDSENFFISVWEPASGFGHIAIVLSEHGYDVASTDIDFEGGDFLEERGASGYDIVTNPPWGKQGRLAEKFIRHALKLTELHKGKVAMLLPVAFDAAKTRRDIFADHPAFAKKYILTTRIRWANLEQKEAGPSKNHAWFIWDWKHSGPPTKGYLP